MVSVSDCSTFTSGARPFRRQHSKRYAEEQSEDCDLQDLILRHGLGNVFRKDIEDHILPAGVNGGRWCHGAGSRGEYHAPARSGKVDGNRADQDPQRGDYLKEDERFERHASHAAQLAVAGDAGYQAAED